MWGGLGIEAESIVAFFGKSPLSGGGGCRWPLPGQPPIGLVAWRSRRGKLIVIMAVGGIVWYFCQLRFSPPQAFCFESFPPAAEWHASVPHTVAVRRRVWLLHCRCALLRWVFYFQCSLGILCRISNPWGTFFCIFCNFHLEQNFPDCHKS